VRRLDVESLLALPSARILAGSLVGELARLEVVSPGSPFAAEYVFTSCRMLGLAYASMIAIV
jgi:hypothetical protein